MSTTTSYTVRNVERINNYLGKPFDSSGYFMGRIYSLKITQADGVNIINLNANKIFNK